MATIPVSPDAVPNTLALVEEAQRQAKRDYLAPRTWLKEISPGYGRHIHDAACGYESGNVLSCMRDCDDSDLIITIAYEALHNGLPYEAVYGVKDGVVTLWMD
jgi:hypothetical protein